MTGVKRDLFGFGKKVVWIAVESHFADASHGHHLFGNQLGRVEKIEVELMLIFFFNNLNAKLPFRKDAVFD